MRIIYIPKKSSIPLANSKYGLLYNWYAASDSRGFVSGWHLPSTSEQRTLAISIGGQATAGKKLKESGYTHWNTPNTGTNDYGFNARGSGIRSGSTFTQLNERCYFASSTSATKTSAMMYNLDSYYEGISDQINGQSIRLICDSSTDPGFVDIDGKRYTTVKIGDQVWMAENLQARHYSDGTPIPFHGTDNGDNFTNAEWEALTTPGLCAYGNDLSNV